jgi:membrane protein
MRKFDSLGAALKLALRDMVHQVREAQLPVVAGHLAYITILSIVPLLAVSFSIFQAFGGMEKLYDTIEPIILNNLAQAASEDAMKAIRGFITNIHAGTLGATGLVGLIFTSMAMLSSVEQAINRVWKTHVQRSLFQRVASYWLFITLGPLAMAFAVGAATSSDIPLSGILPSGTGLFIITALVFFAIYKWVPNRRVDWRPALIAGMLSAVVWNLARWSYAVYTARVLTYRNIYGSLAAVPILLLWIYIIWMVVLSGAAVTAALQKRFEFE